MRAVVPIANLNRRLPTFGRIRVGVKVAAKSKAGKDYERPKSIDTFRFTSHDREALEQVAKVYGGTVTKWDEPRTDPGQHQVISEASQLRIVLPTDALGGTPQYEHWTGGGWDRMCDGEVCTKVVKGPDGIEQVEVPCICAAQEAMACEPHTRLSVILPEVRFGGVWMFDTKSWDAAQEMPGMIALLQEAQGRGLTEGLLRLEQRHKVVAGESRNFPVVVIALAESMDALAAGQARYGIGAGSSAPALPAGTPTMGTVDDGEEGRGSPRARQALAAGTTSLNGGASSPESVPATREGAAPGSSRPVAAPGVSLDDDVVDAELVDDRSLADVLPADASASRALAIARKLGSSATSVEDVHGYELIARVLDDMGLVGEAT